MNATDPVCGKTVDTLRARAVAIVDGVTYYFCSTAHKEQFLRGDGPRPAPPKTESKPAPAEAPKPAAIAVEKKPDPPPTVAAEAAPAEVAVDPPKRSGVMRYVVMLLLLAAGAIAYLAITRKG